jgi:hypothetical protein
MIHAFSPYVDPGERFAVLQLVEEAALRYTLPFACVDYIFICKWSGASFGECAEEGGHRGPVVLRKVFWAEIRIVPNGKLESLTPEAVMIR